MQAQAGLFTDFAPAKVGSPVFCHQDFLEKLHAQRNSPIARKAALLLYRLMLDERRQFYKSTQGLNAGWRRSRLGGNHGSQFYAWWAPRGAPPLKNRADFGEAPPGAIFVRDIRHHDDHSELQPHSLTDHYLPLTARELVQAEYAPLPWTPVQEKFAAARQRVRIVKGYPGSGKTTALWNAAEHDGRESVLYVTFSRELASLAREYFDKFAPAAKRFQVVTYAQLLRELLATDAPGANPERFAPVGVRECRARFLDRIASMSPRTLGPWAGSKSALFDEVHAHLVGSALPIALGRFPASTEPRLSERAYRERREPALGKAAVESLLETVQILRRREQAGFEAALFPELALAWKAGVQLLQSPNTMRLVDFDCIAVDETQDLTPIEAFVLVQLAAVQQARRDSPVSFLAAGDQAQTVRPTDFQWGWFHDLLHHRIESPVEFTLPANVRSPKRIAELVNRVSLLYGYMEKQDRPRGLTMPEIDAEASEQIVHCTAVPGSDLDQLLESLSNQEGAAVISLSDTVPDYVPEHLRPKIFTVFEVKGLDFQTVCVLDPGRHLDRIVHAQDWMRRTSEVEPLNRRLMVDQLRVALSRPAERLYWLEVSPTPGVLERGLKFLTFYGEPALPVIPAVVLKSLEEETLPAEERVRLCEQDARQFLEAKPALAWTRAKQAVSLVGTTQGSAVAADDSVRQSAHLTLAQVSFCLAFRKVRLPEELGRPDLYSDAVEHARLGGGPRMADLLAGIANLDRVPPDARPEYLARFARTLAVSAGEIDAWLRIEIANASDGWLKEIEELVGHLDFAAMLAPVFEQTCVALDARDSAQRAARVRKRAVKALIAGRRFAKALEVAEQAGEASRELRAVCFEGLGDFRAAAELYRELGDLDAAVRCYRSIPDLEKTLELLAETKGHAAGPSLAWIQTMQQLVSERPNNFLKVVTPQETQLLQDILEKSLGVKRKPRSARVKSPQRPQRAQRKPKK